MSADNILNFAELAKRLGTSSDANRFCKSAIRYPPEWKEACLEIVKAYKEEKQIELGRKKLGWQWVRGKIMEPFDVVQSNGKRSPNPNLPDLSRQNLESWADTGSLSDVKFQFIDLFVRRLSFELDDLSPYKSARRINEKPRMRVISDIYQDRTLKHIDAADIINIFGNYSLSEPVENTWFQRIALKVDHVDHGIAKITLAYLPFDIREDVTDADQNVVFFDGFLIPIVTFLMDDFEGSGVNPMHLKCFCLLKLFRPEFRGHHLTGYADGEIEIHIEGDATTGEVKYVFLLMDAPNTVMAPSIHTKTVSHRTERSEILKAYDILRGRGSRDELLKRERNPTDMNTDFKYVLRVFRNEDLDLHVKWRRRVEKIFSYNYVGYLL